MLTILLTTVVAYLLGSFPTGVIAARALAGVDVQSIGSGRTGGSNVLRSAGRNAALITVFGDTFKGVLAVLVARAISGGDPVAAALAGTAVILGHNYSLFLGFKGGAGTMTAGGALGALSPVTLLVSSLVPALMTYVTRMSSVGSLLLSAVALVIGGVLIWQEYLPAAHFLFFLPYFFLSWYSHRPNIQRLKSGTERRLGQKAAH